MNVDAKIQASINLIEKMVWYRMQAEPEIWFYAERTGEVDLRVYALVKESPEGWKWQLAEREAPLEIRQGTECTIAEAQKRAQLYVGLRSILHTEES